MIVRLVKNPDEAICINESGKIETWYIVMKLCLVHKLPMGAGCHWRLVKPVFAALSLRSGDAYSLDNRRRQDHDYCDT